jgi:hypothetical protein
MSATNNKNYLKLHKLKGIIVEYILLYCINYSSILEITFEIQRISPIPCSNVKRYLFYLTDYEFISYNGQKRMFLTEKQGFDLLYKINRKKKNAMVNSEDIEIMLK